LYRWALTAAIALVATCAAAPILAGPILAGARPGPPTWEEQGAGRTDGYSVGLHPLPPRSGPDAASLDAEQDGTAKERWLRRHYQWLRALRGVVLTVSQEDRRGEAASRGPAPPTSQLPGAAAERDRAGPLAPSGMAVLTSGEEDDRVTPHLLDDGALGEDPDAAFGGGEALEFVVSDRLSTETAQIVAQFFSPLSKGVRSFIGPGLAPLAGGERRAARNDQEQMGHQFFSDSQFGGPPARAQAEREVLTLSAFLKRIAVDVLSAPTTYLLSLLALLGWLVLRATVFSRS